jgi:hypothetical protein
VWDVATLRLGIFCIKRLQVVVFPVPEGAEIIMGRPF